MYGLKFEIVKFVQIAYPYNSFSTSIFNRSDYIDSVLFKRSLPPVRMAIKVTAKSEIILVYRLILWQCLLYSWSTFNIKSQLTK